jgi:hypothetical protein
MLSSEAKRRRRGIFVESNRKRISSSVGAESLFNEEPPLRGFAGLVRGFYKDAAPTALGCGLQYVGLELEIELMIRNGWSNPHPH